MKRRLLLPALLFAALVLPAVPAFASLEAPIRVRWSGEWPAPARPGIETIGRIELSVVRAGIVEDFAIAGDGWTVRGAEASGRLVLPPGTNRVVTFRAVPTDPSAPLVVSGTINGRSFREEFRIDAERLSRIGRPGMVRATAAPVLSGTKVPGATTNGGARNIRFRGRFMYERLGAELVGADNIVVRVMDDDTFGDEEIGRFLTDPEGEFDQTISWDDCDITGCDDPDVYLIYEAANLVVEVRTNDSEEMYTWSTEGQLIGDVTADEVDFGLHIADSSPQAVHIYNAIIRAHRFAGLYGEMNGAHTFCHWPAGASGASYSDDFNRIRIGNDEEWNEGTIVHEYGHRLTEQFSFLDDPNYNNGFCDTPTPGHCVWCPENIQDAWQEGFANWFGSVVIRDWIGQYDDSPTSWGDDRYVLEADLSCGPTFYPMAATEGYVGMVLRDIEDVENEDEDGGAADCMMDVLALGAGPVFKVFKDDDPRSIGEFVTKFRARYPDHDANLWATLGNSLPAVMFTQPEPKVSSQPAGCRTLRQDEAFTLTAEGDGALYTYQWRHNGIAVGNGNGLNGATTKSAVMNPVRPWMAGSWDCVVTRCDGLQSVTSAASRIEVQALPAPRAFLSWGENSAAQVGDGTTSNSRPATVHPNMTDIIEIEGGRSFTMALKKNGKMLTWGQNNSGELGHPGFVPQLNTPTEIASLNDVVRIAAGRKHSVALLRDGSVRTWGGGLYGALGNGDFNGRGVPSPTVPFPTCVRDVAASDENTYFLLEDRTVWATGFNDYGNLGRGFTGPRDGAPQVIPGLTNVIAIDAYGMQAMALKADGTVWTWGVNSWGQLGLGHFNVTTTPTQVPGLANITQISVGLDNCYALRNDGIAFAAGYGPALGQGWTGGAANTMLQIPLTGITRIDGGGGYAAVLIGGRLKAFGLNAAVNPPNVGVFNTTHNYVTGTPVDVPQVHDITTFGAGWGTLHAIGQPGIVDVPIADDGVPAVLALAATPNPARAVSSIRFDLPRGGDVALAIYDVAGRLVRTLADETFEPGRHVRPWDGVTNAGARATAGVYFVRMTAPGGTMTKAVVRME